MGKQNLLELNRSVLRGTSHGKILFQPRILCWIADKKFLGEPLPGGLDGISDADIYRNLGCSNRIYEYNACFRQVLPSSVHSCSRELSPMERESVTETPVGKLTAVMQGNTSNPGWFYKKWPVTSEEDLKIALWLAEHTEWEFDGERYDALYQEWGDIGLPTMFTWPRVTVQNLYHDLMGTEQGVYALMDYPRTVEEYFAALNECALRMMDTINASPIEWVNFGDNLHGGTLSPKFFEKYVLPAYQQRCDRLHRAGKFVHAHWDGNCMPLLPYAKHCGLDGIEAITPKPQGDVSLEEMKEALGDEVFLIDGIAAVLFEETFPVKELVAQVHRLIELFAPRLVLGISDEMPSRGDIGRVRLVTEIVNDYNSKQELLRL